jgi:3-methyladenine DNA glycosylase AlkD
MAPKSQAIQYKLLTYADPAYKQFQSALLPTLSPDTIIGVRIPIVRQYAGQLAGSSEAEIFLSELPHTYFDENNLHAALLEHIKDFDTALSAVERFLPYLDNWATCDGFCPKCLRKNPQKLLESIKRWLRSDHPYTVRFALVRLTAWYLEEAAFSPEILALAAEVQSNDYYVRMAQAWFFSIALVKQYESALPYLLNHRLSLWVHNKAIQKARESLRCSSEYKQALARLRVPNPTKAGL